MPRGAMIGGGEREEGEARLDSPRKGPTLDQFNTSIKEMYSSS